MFLQIVCNRLMSAGINDGRRVCIYRGRASATIGINQYKLVKIPTPPKKRQQLKKLLKMEQGKDERDNMDGINEIINQINEV